MKREYLLKYDEVFKSTINKENILIRFLKEFLELNVSQIKLLDKEMPIENKFEKRKILDMIVHTDKGLINIEVNNDYKPGLINRNLLYFFKLVSSSLDRTDEYEDIDNYIQLNLTWNLDRYVDYDVSDIDKLEYFIIEEHTLKKLVSNIKIVTYNMDYFLQKWYNDDIENVNPFIMLLAAPTIKAMEKISKGDKIMEEITNKVKKLNIDPDLPRKIAIEDDEQKFINTAYKKGQNEGIEQGKNEAIKNIVKNLINKNMSDDEIINIVDITYSDLNKLKKEIIF